MRTDNDNEWRVVRRFAMGQAGNDTQIRCEELASGNITVSLVTERDGLEPFVTSMTLKPNTLNLLSHVISLAAHDSSVWQPVPNEVKHDPE